MRIEVNRLSTKYKVRELTSSDAVAVCDLESTNPLYFEHCPPSPDVQSVLDDMRALPPKKTLQDKYYIGFFEGDLLIAVMDLILNYPDEETAFIGLFMVLSSKQGCGVGTEIISECLSRLNHIGFSFIRLGYMKDNPQSRAFWYKNQFRPTGIETDNGQGIVVLMERQTGIMRE